MGDKLPTEGLTRQPPQAKFKGNLDKNHPWRHKEYVVSEKKRQAKKLAAHSRPTAPVGRNQDTLYGRSQGGFFVCVSCGMPECIGGECSSSWD